MDEKDVFFETMNKAARYGTPDGSNVYEMAEFWRFCDEMERAAILNTFLTPELSKSLAGRTAEDFLKYLIVNKSFRADIHNIVHSLDIIDSVVDDVDDGRVIAACPFLMATKLQQRFGGVSQTHHQT